MNHEDIPLTDMFYQNPLEYMQSYVRGLNNQIFLSEYQINNLYALLLIGRNSPWDNIKANSERIKEDIDVIVNQKVIQVKSILENLSNMYEDKSKKSAISQIQKLMGILKSKNKSIFIEKDVNCQSYKNLQMLHQLANLQTQQRNVKQQQGLENIENQVQLRKEELPQQTINQQMIKTQNNKPQIKQSNKTSWNQLKQLSQDKPQYHHHHHASTTGKEDNISQSHHAQEFRHDRNQQIQEPRSQIRNEKQKKETQARQSKGGNKQVFTIFYGLANLSSLSSLALTNILDYNSSERFIKFKMSQSYNMIIKNNDPYYFDRMSMLSKIPTDLYINHIFPYLTASQLFYMRGVCKQWLESVKESWHATFKRQMFIQLLACQFCKDIEFFYKIIQLRNPFFQKLSLLIHALIEIIQWQNVYLAIENGTVSEQLKRILIIILRLIGQPIQLTTLAAINAQFFNLHKHRLVNLKEKVTLFFTNLSGSDLSINDLKVIKTQFMDDPFMRIEQINSDDKSPLLLTLFAKQMNLQQILRNHIFLCQQYLLNAKKRLDNISKKMVYQKGYLEGVYKILLLKSTIEPIGEQKDQAEMPNFQNMLQSIFSNRNSEQPDFVIKNKTSSTEIYLDNATKLDLILTTVCNLQQHRQNNSGPQQKQQVNREQKLQKNLAQDKQTVLLRGKQKNRISNEINLKISSKQEQADYHQDNNDKK